MLYLVSLFINWLGSEIFLRSYENSSVIKLAKNRNLLTYKCYENTAIRLLQNNYLLDAGCISYKGSNQCIYLGACNASVIADLLDNPQSTELICTPSMYANKAHVCNRYLIDNLTRLFIEIGKK